MRGRKDTVYAALMVMVAQLTKTTGALWCCTLEKSVLYDMKICPDGVIILNNVNKKDIHGKTKAEKIHYY